MEKFNELIGNRTRDLPVFSIVSQPTTLPRSPISSPAEYEILLKFNNAPHIVGSNYVDFVADDPDMTNLRNNNNTVPEFSKHPFPL
jgi:hypothetical protein